MKHNNIDYNIFVNVLYNVLLCRSEVNLIKENIRIEVKRDLFFAIFQPLSNNGGIGIGVTKSGITYGIILNRIEIISNKEKIMSDIKEFLVPEFNKHKITMIDLEKLLFMLI